MSSKTYVQTTKYTLWDENYQNLIVLSEGENPDMFPDEYIAKVYYGKEPRDVSKKIIYLG